MDSVSIMWAFILVLPVILIMALCIGCRESAPKRIPQSVDDYDFRSSYMSHPSSSFAVMRHPSTGIPSNFSSSLPVTASDAFLSVPSSPLAPDSRRSSFTPAEVDNESVPSYENQDQKQTEDDEYINDTYISGYIDVLPDIVEPPVPCPEPMPEPETEEQMQSDRISSDSLEYVNVPDQQEARQHLDNFSQEGGSNRDSEEDTPDYENVTHRSRD
ncbi:uncharacterized protein LOC115094248 isoform X3 [Rhinatrema bivittatum]|uniref:uncharacterized protein LOC115094248 isoform X3 n=1 Tax=Rhinatrema bivittatum TaxID=194408 RepID=UPI0011279B4A|nr:uncharacterized protein LOC115094248 isoform X3 [Rhinatrema bivittatum]